MSLNTQQKERLKRLETKLHHCVRDGSIELAIEITTDIQGIFGEDRSNHRLLRDKLWCFEAALLANRLDWATRGVEGVRGRATEKTKLHLEATVLLVVCYLRQKRIADAKKLIAFVLSNQNRIPSARSRHLFQKKFLERIEQECVLSELVGTNEGELDVETIKAKADYLLENNSAEQVYAAIGNSLPPGVALALVDVRAFALQQIRPDDVKLLAPPREAQSPPNLGKQAFAVFKRIAWKAFCSSESTVFKLWDKQLTKTYSDGFMAAGLVATMKDWKIGLPLLGAGILAAVTKYTAREFCEWAKPEVFMTTRKEIVCEKRQT